MRSAGGRSVLLARHPLQAVPATLHAFGLHANNGGNGVGVGGDGGTTQNARAAALADPVGGGPGLAIGGGDRDVAAAADDDVKRQLFGQQPVDLACSSWPNTSPRNCSTVAKEICLPRIAPYPTEWDAVESEPRPD